MPKYTRMMGQSDVRPTPGDWLGDGVQIRSEGEVVYFAGCLPMLGAYFGEDLGFDGAAIARSTVQLLNAAGVEPAMLPDERCCGHDLLFQGDVAGFLGLATGGASTASAGSRASTTCGTTRRSRCFRRPRGRTIATPTARSPRRSMTRRGGDVSAN